MLVAVVVILTLLPEAQADLTVWLANLTLTQIYVPLTLTAGLTQMWSLSVEMSFYLVLPLLALLSAYAIEAAESTVSMSYEAQLVRTAHRMDARVHGGVTFMRASVSESSVLPPG